MSRAQRYKVRVAGVDHEVQVAPAAESPSTRVVVEGRSFEVFEGPDGTSIVRATDETEQLVVRLAPGRRPASASVGGRVLDLEIRTAQAAALEEALAQSTGAAGGSASVTAPMPGRVVRVLCAAGDVVELDQPLVIVEAMKMENEVRSPAAGKIRSVAVQPGQTVESGHVLCELEPPAS